MTKRKLIGAALAAMLMAAPALAQAAPAREQAASALEVQYRGEIRRYDGDRRFDDRRFDGDRRYDDRRFDGDRRYDDRRFDGDRRYDDRRFDPRDYRSGFRDGQRFDDRYEDPRLYRRGFQDGRRFDRFAYRPHFGTGFDYGRRHYSRYDYFDAPWRRPYVIGRPLPRGIGFRKLDPYAYRGLPPCPRGYYYADVGGDILLVALATGIVADALVY